MPILRFTKHGSITTGTQNYLLCGELKKKKNFSKNLISISRSKDGREFSLGTLATR